MKSFVDISEIVVKAGNGGDGLVSFRHEKYVPKGGPDGGNGGNGGSVYLRATSRLTTLYDFTHRHIFAADDGQPGGKALRTGKSGEDLYLDVPIGSVVYELAGANLEDDKKRFTANSELLKIGDLTVEGQTMRVAKGGKGGRGNDHFKSSTHQTPYDFEYGTEGEERKIIIELKVVADAGLIGMPNAGKSTLLAALTKARPEIADYPFTTLSPNLGVMELYDRHIILADIPGLIEGASEGKGLGDEFLRHVERTRILVHLIDPLYEDPIKSYETIRNELKAYSEKLVEKREIVVINKTDLTEVQAALPEITQQFKKKYKLDIVPISAVAHKGLSELQERIYRTLEEEASRPSSVEEVIKPVPVFRMENLKKNVNRRGILEKKSKDTNKL